MGTRVLPDRCVRGLSRLVRCRACEESCPRTALDLRKGPVAVSVSSRCDGCGLCWSKCPTEALVPSSAGDEPDYGRDLLVLCRKGSVERMCGNEEPVLRVPCVRDIGFRFLVGRWFLGLRRIWVCGADCSRCDAASTKGAEDGVWLANEILLAAGQVPMEVSPLDRTGLRGIPSAVHQTLGGTQPGTDRRGFFQAMLSAALDASLNRTPPAGPPEVEAVRKSLFLEAMDQINREGGQPGGCAVAAYRLRISPEACYGCRACVLLCSTGALSWDEEDKASGRARLLMDPSRCIGCRVCRDVCDVDAIEITLGPGLRGQDTVLFREGQCTACDRTYWSANPMDSLCPGCRMNRRFVSRTSEPVDPGSTHVGGDIGSS